MAVQTSGRGASKRRVMMITGLSTELISIVAVKGILWCCSWRLFRPALGFAFLYLHVFEMFG
jgi:hypothetical protein